MSTVSSPPPGISQTAPPPSSSSPIASIKPVAAVLSSIPSSSPPATSPMMSSTLSVPKAAPTKPSRQATNPDKHTTSGTHSHSSMASGHGGLPSGLPPAALNLSPGGVARLGSRSPSSIPSSPTSIHSSSSAIFERDIEPLGLPSLSVPQTTAGSNISNPTTPMNSHRIPRSKTTEAIEMTVPSVLDSAVSALSIADETGANVTVFSPAAAQGVHPLSQSYSNSAVQSPTTAQSPLSLQPQSSPLNPTFAHPTTTGPGGIGSLGSASGTSAGSPSPPTMSLLLQGMGMSGLVSASASVSGAEPTSGFQSGMASPLSSSRAPSPARSASPPTINNISELTPGAAAAASSTGSPRSVAKETSVYTSSPIKRPSLPPPAPGATIPSPSMRASNRLSFISYTDLLTSAPIASQPLSTVLNPGQNEPPTHLVVVDPENPTGALGMTPTTSSGYLPLTGVSGIGSLNVGGAGDKLDVDSLGTVGLSTTGEWGREGMGGGLEERLERLWAAEREMNERGRVQSTGTRAGGVGSRSGSMGVSVSGDTQPPRPTMTMTPPPAPAPASTT